MSDFGPLVVIIGMSFLCALPSWKGMLSFLEVIKLSNSEVVVSRVWYDSVALVFIRKASFDLFALAGPLLLSIILIH